MTDASTSAAVTALAYYQGDAWIVIVTLFNPDGTAMILTGTEPNLWLYYGDTGTPIYQANPADDPLTNFTTGQLKFIIPGGQDGVTKTIPIDPVPLPANYRFPCRGRILLVDTLGNCETQGVVDINVLGI